MKATVIYGSVRRKRQGIKAARFVVRQLRQREHDVDLIDPLEYQLPMLDLRYREYEEGSAPSDMEKISGLIRESDRKTDPEMDDERRVYYGITGLGRKVLAAELQRYREVVAVARRKRLSPKAVSHGL